MSPSPPTPPDEPDERWAFAQSIARYVESHPQWDVMSPHDAAVHAAHVIAVDEGAFNRLCDVVHAPRLTALAVSTPSDDGERPAAPPSPPRVGDRVRSTRDGGEGAVLAVWEREPTVWVEWDDRDGTGVSPSDLTIVRAAGAPEDEPTPDEVEVFHEGRSLGTVPRSPLVGSQGSPGGTDEGATT